VSILNRRHFSDLRGMVRLAVDATVGVTDLVEKMHHTIQLAHPPLGTSTANRTGGVTGLVYRSIRGTTRLVGGGLDAGMAPLVGYMPETASPEIRDAVVSAINGIYGDHLVETNNPLAIRMDLRFEGAPLDPEKPETGFGHPGVEALTGKVMLFVHGLCLNDNHWARDGRNHAEALATRLGYTPLFLRYNTGLPIATNGQALALMLENLLQRWPQPVFDMVIAGHSMGGLVARSAAHHAGIAGHDWLQHLNHLVSIGTPHHGAPLERGGNWLDYAMDLSPYAAPFTRIGKKRSAGITDLRHGSITGQQGEFVPLPTNVKCYAMASTLAEKRNSMGEKLIGDGLVPVDSALGQSRHPGRDLSIPEDQQWLGYDTGHLELLGSTEVYEQLHTWLR
jgi:pimeloyl-ACP methyl ester carboxylesterase